MKRQVVPLIFVIFFFISAFTITDQTPEMNSVVTEDTATAPHIIAQDGDVHRMVIPSINDESVSSYNPTNNYHDNVYNGGLFVGRNIFGSYYTGRSWLMFNLTHLPQDLEYINASLTVYCNASSSITDRSIGAYYSSDDLWREETITWNNQPTFSPSPEDSIDTPASPSMFIDDQWYSWDVTTVFDISLAGDNVLSLVLKQVDEGVAEVTWKYFTERNCSEYFAPYISVYYRTPTTSDLSVDGFSSPPDTDVIYNTNPEFAWQFNDFHDDQRSYEINIVNSEDELAWRRDLGSVDEVFTTGVDEISPPFAQGNSLRMQLEWKWGLVGESGIVDRFYLGTSAPSGTRITLHNLTVLMKTKIYHELDSVFTNNYEGEYPTTVLLREYLELTANDGYFEIDIENTFAVGKSHLLLIEIRYSNQTDASVSCLAETGEGNGFVAFATGPAGTGAETSEVASTIFDRTCNLKLDLLSHTVVDTGSSGSQYPFDYDSARVQMTYNSTLVGRSGYIDRLYYECSYSTSFRPYMSFENFTVRLAETLVEGPLYLTFSSNYGGHSPIQVLYRDQITIHNTGYWFEIVLDTPFHYHQNGALLVEMLWDARTSPYYLPPTFSPGGPGYRAIASDSSASTASASDDTTYSLALGFLDSEDTYVYDGTALPSDDYTMQVRTCDTLGMWSPWTELDFTYFLPGDGPRWSNLVDSSDPAEVNQSLTVEIDAIGFLGVSSVLIEYGGMNHSMASSGNTYSHAWIPLVLGYVDYTLYLQDGMGFWNVVTGSVLVHDTVSPSILTHPSDIEFTLGSLGNRFEWSVEEHLPWNYFIYVDSVLERSGPWDGSTIGFTVNGLEVGEHNVILRVVDTSGNEGTDTVVVTVSATQPGTGVFELTNLLLIAVGALGILNLVLILVVLVKKPRG